MNTYTLIHIAYPWKSFEPSESLDSTDVPPPSSQAVQGNVPMGVTCVWAVTMGCPSTDRTLARTLGRTEVGGFPARGKAKIWKFELMTPRVLKCSLDGTWWFVYVCLEVKHTARQMSSWQDHRFPSHGQVLRGSKRAGNTNYMLEVFFWWFVSASSPVTRELRVTPSNAAGAVCAGVGDTKAIMFFEDDGWKMNVEDDTRPLRATFLHRCK